MSDDLPIQFLTSHALCLLYVARQPESHIQNIASAVGITKRYCTRVMSELEGAGYLTRSREWRTTVYELRGDATLELLGVPVTVEAFMSIGG